MYDHLAQNHPKQAQEMIDSQYIEVAYVSSSQRKTGESEWKPIVGE